MKYLIKTTEIYRVDSEQEAKEFIEQQKQTRSYSVSKYSSEYKYKKEKGEVVDEWYRVTIVKEFTDEKEPSEDIQVLYHTNTIFDQGE